MNETEVGKLYSALVGKGYSTEDIGSEEIFRSKMVDKDNRKLLYDWVSANGDFKIGDYDTYESRLTQVQKKPERQSPYSVAPADYTQKTEAQKNYEERGDFEPKGQGTVNLNDRDVPVLYGKEGEFRVPSPVALDEQEEIFRHGNPSEEEVREYKSKVDSRENFVKTPQYAEGIGEGLKEGGKGLWAGVKHFAGEAANLVTGSSMDAASALQLWKDVEGAKGNINSSVEPMSELAARYHYNIAGYGPSGQVVLSAKTGKAPTAEEVAESKAIIANESAKEVIRNAIKEAGGDIDKAKKMLEENAQAKTLGDEWIESAQEDFESMRPTKGVGAWIGNLLPQMAPTAAALALSVATKNPKWAKMVGNLGMGTMTAATAGQSMKEARDAGATNGQTWAVGITDGVIELITEKIPFDKYTKGVVGGFKKKTAQQLADAVATPKGANEMEKLLREANNKLGGKLFSGENAKDYMAMVAAEGLSEFSAEALQTMTSMIYEHPDEYPTITEVLGNGLEGAKAGIFMGSFLGAGSKIASHHGHDERRKQQGYINFAETKKGDVVEVLGVDKDNNMVVVDSKGEQQRLKQDEVGDVARVTYKEFKNAEIDKQKQKKRDEYQEVRDDLQAGESMTGEELQNANLELQRTGNELMRMTGMSVDELTNMSVDDVLARIDEANEQGNMELEDLWRSYKQASSFIQGNNMAVDNAINEQSAASDAEVDAITDENGMIVPATTRGGEQVYIIGGNVVLNGDNSVNKEGSSAQLTVVRDGKRTTMGIVELESVDAPIDAAGEKVSRRTAIEENLRRQQRIDMGEEHVFTPGEKFETLQGEVQFVADRGDGTADITVNGNATVVDMGTLNEQFNTAKQMEYNARKAEETSQAQTEVPQPVNDEQVTSEVAQSALQRVPKDEQGEPIYEQVDSDTAWDAIVEQTEGDEAMAQTVADGMVADKEAALKKLEKAKAKGGATIAEKIAAEKERMAAIEAAKAELAKWKEIAGVAASRKAVAPDINDASETETVATEGTKPTESVEVPAVEDVQPANEMQPVEVDQVEDNLEKVTVPSEAENRTEPIKKAEQSIEAVNKRKRQKPAGRYLKEDAKLGDYLDFEDYVMREIATGGVKFIWGNSTNSKTKGLAAHLGLRGNSERMRRIWMLDNKNGGYPEIVAYDLLSGYASLFGNGMPEEVTGMTDIDALDVLLEVLGAYDSPRAMFEAAQKRHNAIEDPYYDISEEEIEAMAMHMSLDEWKAYQEYLMAETEFIFNNVSDEELYSIFAEEYLTQDYERSRENAELQQGILEGQGRESRNAESNTVLQGEQLNNTGENKRGETAGPERNDVPVEQGAVDVPEASVFENAEVERASQVEEETSNSTPTLDERIAEYKELLRQLPNRDAKSLTKKIERYLSSLKAQNNSELNEEIHEWQAKLEAIKELLQERDNGSWKTDFGVKLSYNKELSIEDVKTIFEHTNSDKAVATLFDKVYNVAKTLGLKIKVSDQLSVATGNAGNDGMVKYGASLFYRSDIDNQTKAGTLLHELIHTCTMYATTLYRTRGIGGMFTEMYEALPQEIKDACVELNRIYELIKYREEFKGEYAITSVDEMVAELSNVKFRDKMKKVGLWERLVNAIKRLFDFPIKTEGEQRTTDALSEAERVLDTMLENFDKNSYDEIRAKIQSIGKGRKRKIEQRTEIQQTNLAPSSDNPAFEAATKNTIDAVKKTGVEVVEATPEMVQAVLPSLGFSTSAEEFKARAKAAEEQAGIVAYGLNEQELPITKVEKHSFEGNLKNARQEAKSWAENNFVGNEYNMPESGGKYIITKRAIGKYVDKTAVEKSENPSVHLSALVKLPEIISNSVDAEIHPDYIKGEDGVRRKENGIGNRDLLVHRLYGAIEIGGKVYRVKTTMHELLNSNDANSPHSYEVTQIELIEDSTAAPIDETSNPLNRSTNSISAAKLLNGVEKSYDEGKKLLETSKNIPEFHRVFHGSGAKFDKFDHSHMGEGEGAQAYGWGTYVTEVEGIGKQYAEVGNTKLSRLRAKIGNIDAALHFVDLDVEKAKRELEQTNNATVAERAKYTIENAENRREALYKERASVEMEMTKFGRHLYTIEIPDDNGSNYLHWEERINGEIQERIANGLQSIGFEIEPGMNHLAYSRDEKIAVLNINAKGKDLYAELSEALGGDKQASLFLNEMGFVGISYPAQATTGGRKDGARNYVIFNEADAQIVDHVQFLRTEDGTVYGWAVNGKIFLTPEGMNPNTPAHEYTHLWAAMVEKNDPKLWSRIVEAMKESPIWNEVLLDEAYRDIWKDDNRMASEVLSRLSGEENYRRAMEEAEQEIKAADGIVEKAKKIALWGHIKQALADFWTSVKSVFGLTDKSPWTEFVDMALGDLYGGVNPNAEGSPLERMFIGEKGAANLDKAEEDINFRSGEGAYSDEEVAVESDPVSKILGKPRFTRKLRREFAERERKRMRKAVDDVASALHTPIEVLESTEGLTGRRAKAKGWYEKSTGKIVVVLPNNRSVADVMQTVLHEAVAHHGLRKLFGSGFDNFIDNIYNNVDAETRQKINLLASRNGWNLKVATEEYLASLAEDANFERVNPSIWQRIKSFFLDMLAEAGVRLDIELSDNELRYILWRSYQNLKYPGKYRTIADEARDIAKQGELKVGNYAENVRTDVNVAEESDEGMVIGKENSISLPNNFNSKENVNDRKTLPAARGARAFIERNAWVVQRDGRAERPTQEVEKIISDFNRDKTVYARTPLQLQTLALLRVLTNNEIDDIHDALEVLSTKVKDAEQRKEYGEALEVVKRFKNRNERGTIIRDLTGADLGEEIPLAKIDELFEMYNSDVKTAELYKRVRPFAEELGITFVFDELEQDEQGGIYTPSDNSIVYNAHMLYAPYVSQQRKASTIVHEMIHAVTVFAISAKKNNIKLSPKLEKAAQTINDIYDNVVKGNPLLVHEEYNAKTDKMEPVADYGASSAYEMISELSNPEFVEKLKQIEYDGRSVWQRIWDAIKSIFVGKNETPSVYEQLSNAFDTIVENFDREAYERTKEDGYKFFNIISDIAEQEDDVLFRSDEQLSAQQLYDKDVSGLAYNIKEGWVDRYSSLKAMMEAIKNETGKDVADYANIYYAMEHLSARNRAKMDVVMGQYVEPLMAMVNEFAKIGITQKELERYLNSKHGLERNREMAVADACRVDKDGKKVFDQKKFNVWETKRDAIYAQNMSWADTEAALDKLAKTFGVSLNKDYSGLTAIYKDREKGLSRRKAAYDAVVEFERKAGTELIKNLWEGVNAINNFSLDESFASGIMSKDTRDRLKGRYKYYVPLRGFNDKAVTEYEYLSSIDFPLQGINKAAHGRHSEATDIIPTMMNMMESAVVLGNKNRAKLALLHLAEQYPTKLLTVSNSWYSYNAVNDTWVPVAHPQLTPNMTPEQVADTVNQWEADMRDLEKQGKAKRFSSSLQIDKVGLETWKQDEHSVKVKRNGKEYVIWVNGNPKAAQAINGILGVQSQDTSKFFQWSEKANRWRAKNITSRNPEFVLGNFARDIQQASKVSFIKYGFKYLKSFEANLWRHSIPKIHKLYYLYGKGKLNMNDPVHRMFNEFMQAGSETGFVTMMSIEDYQKKIDKLVSPTLLDKVGKPINVAVDAFGTATELANRGVENACRFAAFMTSRNMGHSLLESVNDAKEVSLNFDRKGSGAYGNMEARQMKMFLNPTIQGLAQQITLIQKYPARAIPVTMAEMAMGYFAGKAAIYLFNWVASLFTGDDDEKYNYSYYNIPEFVRRNNLIIPTGRGVNDYVVIPLSHEQRVAYGVGEILGAFKSGHMDSKDVAVSLIAQAAQALPMNPFDAEAFIDPNRSVWENFLKTVSPDILVPGLEALFFNENFAGMRVTNQSDFNKHLPEYKRALKNTPKYMVELSKIINEATGGTSGKKGWADSPYTNNPAVWDHLAKAYLGGMYSFPSKIGKTILGYGFDDDDFREPENWPIIGKFYMDTSGYEQNPEERTRRDYENAFYKFKDEYGAAAKELTTYKKEITSSDEEVAKEARENLKAFEESKRNGRFVGYFKQVEKVEKNLKEALDKAREFKDKELEDELEQRLILLKKEAVKYVETQDELYDMK